MLGHEQRIFPRKLVARNIHGATPFFNQWKKRFISRDGKERGKGTLNRHLKHAELLQSSFLGIYPPPVSRFSRNIRLQDGSGKSFSTYIHFLVVIVLNSW